MMTEHDKTSAAAASVGCAHENNGVRCGCGSLLARRTPGGLELKCRRCKRILVVEFEPDEEAAVAE
jgi:phage FluMu protein Com